MTFYNQNEHMPDFRTVADQNHVETIELMMEGMTTMQRQEAFKIIYRMNPHLRFRKTSEEWLESVKRR